MDSRYDLQTNNIFMGDEEIPSYSLEKNEIGTCNFCDSPLFSLSYHSFEEKIFVATKCNSCGAFYLNIYDSGWNWLDEVSLSLVPIPVPLSNPSVKNLAELEAVSEKKLEAVFSRGEIEAIFARARAETPVRQYLYRARKKYELFEEIFELKLEF